MSSFDFDTVEEFLMGSEVAGPIRVADLDMPDVTSDHLQGGVGFAAFLVVALQSDSEVVQSVALVCAALVAIAVVWFGARVRRERHETVRAEIDATTQFMVIEDEDAP